MPDNAALVSPFTLLPFLLSNTGRPRQHTAVEAVEAPEGGGGGGSAYDAASLLAAAVQKVRPPPTAVADPL